MWRHQQRRNEIGIYLPGDNAMPRRGIGEGAGVWAHFLPTWSRRTRRAWFLFFRRSPSRFRQLGSTTGEVQNLSINVVCALQFARYPWRQNQILNEKLLVWACLDSEFNINFYINLFNSSRYKFLALQMDHNNVAIS